MNTPPPTPPSPADLTPSPDHPFEPEFAPNPPRPIPPELHRGRYARSQRRTALGFITAGLLCLACSPIPLVKHWGLYFVPFQHLGWIGLALIAFPIARHLFRLLHDGPFRYVREGVPLVCRVRAIALVPAATHNGQPTAYHFVATVDYLDPATNRPASADVTSNHIAASLKDSYTASYRVGDHATAVYLPLDPARTLRLYGFLDLRPGLGVVRREHAEEIRPLHVAALILAIFAFVAFMLFNIDAYGRYKPLDLTFQQGVVPFAVGAVILGGGTTGFLVWAARRERRRLEERNRTELAAGRAVELPLPATGWSGVQGRVYRLVAFAGALLLGGATTLSWAYAANALLDRSPAEFRPVQITQAIQETHGIFREYKLKYRFPAEPTDTSHTLNTTPDHIQQFANADAATAELRAGRFGWKWVQTIHPHHPTSPQPENP